MNYDDSEKARDRGNSWPWPDPSRKVNIRQLDKPKWRTKKFQGQRRYADKPYEDKPRSIRDYEIPNRKA